MTENKGLAIEQMMRTYIIPYLKTQMSTSKEISATLDANGITQLDSMYVKAEVTRRKNTHIKKHMLADNGLGGEVAPPFDEQGAANDIQNELNTTGNQRFIKPSSVSNQTWAELFKDLQWNVEVEVTGETTDKQAVLTSLTNLFETIADPVRSQVLKTPAGKLLFNKILETTGNISPIEINEANMTPPQPPQAQQPVQPQQVQPV